MAGQWILLGHYLLKSWQTDAIYQKCIFFSKNHWIQTPVRPSFSSFTLLAVYLRLDQSTPCKDWMPGKRFTPWSREVGLMLTFCWDPKQNRSVFNSSLYSRSFFLPLPLKVSILDFRLENVKLNHTEWSWIKSNHFELGFFEDASIRISTVRYWILYGIAVQQKCFCALLFYSYHTRPALILYIGMG